MSRRGCTCIVRKSVAAGATSKLCHRGVAPALPGKEWLQEQEASFVPAGQHLQMPGKSGCRSNCQEERPAGVVLLDETGKNSYTVIVC